MHAESCEPMARTSGTLGIGLYPEHEHSQIAERDAAAVRDAGVSARARARTLVASLALAIVEDTRGIDISMTT